MENTCIERFDGGIRDEGLNGHGCVAMRHVTRQIDASRIDVDFEHDRGEAVMQPIYNKYGRTRARRWRRRESTVRTTRSFRAGG
ncbi:hypothetical protein [Burkholderia lata]|uniref:hypothetical protein n=1 Tax=Burkholderia lata (strain ATCC 17760 / DSM 23089 / LMG 22485 / NCIMB 9086 / R18194 / 383) TaxID=482957 RepID=UPI0015822A6E|nr:hypothetical protein [Burkholderia lata]